MCPTIVPYTYEAKKEKRIYFTSLLKDMKVLVATEKPFAKKAVEGVRGIVEEAGYELALLEKIRRSCGAALRRGRCRRPDRSQRQGDGRSDRRREESQNRGACRRRLRQRRPGSRFGPRDRGDEHPRAELQCGGRTGPCDDDLHGAQRFYARHGIGDSGQDAGHPCLRQRRQARRPQGQGDGDERHRLRSVRDGRRIVRGRRREARRFGRGSFTRRPTFCRCIFRRQPRRAVRSGTSC